MKAGVLALQGDVAEHRAVLEALGVEVAEIRRPGDLEGVEALVLPGGESTTLGMLLRSSGLYPLLAELLVDGLPVLGTCAGMILLAAEVLGGRADQASFGVIDIVVRRNAFGRQLQSFESDLLVAGLDGPPLHAVFIRAPVVERAGPQVEVLASVELGGEEHPVVCRQGNVLVASFHPELAGEGRLHALLLEGAQGR